MDHLAEYPDSSDDRDTPSTAKRLPPPPDLLDLPSGKKNRHAALQLPRVVPVLPREDKFLVHVYLPVVHPRLDRFVNRLMGMARLRLTGGNIKAAFTVLPDFHVSIARPVAIREAQIRDLVAALAEALKPCSRVRLSIRAAVEAFESGNRRRLFVAAPLSKPAAQEVVKGVIRAVDAIFEARKLPTFFEDPRPHMSFAWTETVDVLPQFSECNTAALAMVHDEDELELVAEKVECSIGKSKYYFALNK